MPEFSGFPKQTMVFLKDLAANNNREWFQTNKTRYEAAILEPALGLIAAMQKPLESISPHLLAVPKKVGGSLMRIYKDTRFSKEKTPYKTNIGIHFRHEMGKDVHAPGCYLHIEPDDIFLGVEIWHPDKEPLAIIREAIADDPTAWKKAVRSKQFLSEWTLSGDSLKRPPAGFDADHPLIDEIKRKDFIGVAHLEPEMIHSAKLIPEIVSRFKKGTGLMTFLCRALDVPF